MEATRLQEILWSPKRVSIHHDPRYVDAAHGHLVNFSKRLYGVPLHRKESRARYKTLAEGGRMGTFYRYCPTVGDSSTPST